MLLSCRSYLSAQDGFFPLRADDLKKAAELVVVRGEDGSRPKLSGQFSKYVHTCLCVCVYVGSAGTRERLQCLDNDSVFAGGHSIFHEPGGEVLDTEPMALTALLMQDTICCTFL